MAVVVEWAWVGRWIACGRVPVSVDVLTEEVTLSGGSEELQMSRFFLLRWGREASREIRSLVPKMQIALSAVSTIENPRYVRASNSWQ